MQIVQFTTSTTTVANRRIALKTPFAGSMSVIGMLRQFEITILP